MLRTDRFEIDWIGKSDKTNIITFRSTECHEQKESRYDFGTAYHKVRVRNRVSSGMTSNFGLGFVVSVYRISDLPLQNNEFVEQAVVDLYNFQCVRYPISKSSSKASKSSKVVPGSRVGTTCCLWPLQEIPNETKRNGYLLHHEQNY